MEAIQGMLWPQEEIDIFAPQMKTKQELRKEKSETLKKKIVERFKLSDEEFNNSDCPLLKEELINTIYYHNTVCEKEFLESKQGLIETVGYHVKLFNPGLPQMLLTSLSHYSKKDQEKLNISDLLVMYKSLEDVLNNQEIGGDNFKKFRNENELSFFGLNQYLLSKEYLESIRKI
jgi:hypothetical protein